MTRSWAHHVGSHPKRYAAASLIALVALAVPAMSMRIGMPADGTAAKDHTERKAYDYLADGFGKGFNGPLMVVIDMPTSAQAAIARVQTALEADPGIAAVAPAQIDEAGDTATLIANPTTAPQDAKTDTLVRHLRSDVLPATVEGTNAKALLSGQAMATDMTDRISSRLPIFIAAVVLVSFLLLVIVFRSTGGASSRQRAVRCLSAERVEGGASCVEAARDESWFVSWCGPGASAEVAQRQHVR